MSYLGQVWEFHLSVGGSESGGGGEWVLLLTPSIPDGYIAG